MPATDYSPGAGDVPIEVGGATYVLRPTLEAALAISRQFGGIREAMSRVNSLDLDAVVSVIRAGMGTAEARKIKNLEAVIWGGGLLSGNGELILGCVNFLIYLANGGRPSEGSDGGEVADGNPTTQQ